ncbi:MAG: preprotein translocase subunit YajC [Methylococcaceae bacterium]|nr:MAG: preprotein translocase subunit YajC [Methylococcaceae bacterium]
MAFLISDAFAEGAAGAAGAAGQDPGFAGLLFPVAILAVFFFLFIRPQQRRQNEHKKMVESLNKGSDVVTNGGLLGRVVDLDDSFVRLEVADNIYLQVQKHAIASLMPKGTYKSVKKQQQ